MSVEKTPVAPVNGRRPPFVRPLLTWFARHRRAMPWRDEPTPYRVWISEIMLQQTQVDTVRPYFERFIHAFPDPETLARAPLQEVLRLWEGLGYYARARHLHAAARQVVETLGGCIPRTRAELRRLPGLGDYAAAAVASIAFGEPVAAVDGNVLRVFTRVWGLRDDIARASTRAAIASRLTPCIPRHAAGDFNQAVMELGALVCRPRNPLCGGCPLRRWCRACAEGLIGELPVRARGRRTPRREQVVALVLKRGRVLIRRRDEKGLLGGLWEFPSTEPLPGEDREEGLLRELHDGAGLDVRPIRRLGSVEHVYSHFSATMLVVECECVCVTPAGTAPDCRWVFPKQLEQYPLSTAYRRIADRWLPRSNRSPNSH